MTTQIVILAAGMGSRLGRSLPKPLTQLSDGRSIMRQQHDNIHAAFGREARITTVVGYRADEPSSEEPSGLSLFFEIVPRDGEISETYELHVQPDGSYDFGFATN